ncbi:uncharacterized protein LOC130429910 [Triplophysa dalaica]|uniref:uncharacterized protein LOC130429910 n=1 Tax=Triplophysa dalaica TaxID=1582913 RepID=UPI0024DFE3C5|nr:uncharacterized protein LOC130429910 [Triplophysa dalaica]
MTFGLLKARSHCLHKSRVSPVRACDITVACAVLPNVACLRKERAPRVPPAMEWDNPAIFPDDDSVMGPWNCPNFSPLYGAPGCTSNVHSLILISTFLFLTETIRKVSVKKGDSLTLNTGDAFTQRPDWIHWDFEQKCIAELIGKRPAVVDKNERFTDRLELDPKTGSLTITNSKTTDSGLYTLKTPERKFDVTVTSRPLLEKRPELKTENIKPVSVNEGESLTLSTEDAFTKSPDRIHWDFEQKCMIKWMFKNICIAEFTGIQYSAADVDKDDRFTGRLELDYNNASLTITNITSKDSGRYRLRTRTGDSERTFNVTVSEENDSEAAHTPLKTESHPLLPVGVAKH